MKYIKTIALSLLALAGGCIEDKGNYAYSELNTIEIEGITTDSIYLIDQFETLTLAPTLRFSGKPHANLSHEWKINYEVVSTDSVLNEQVSLEPNTATAYYSASLAVTDNDTGLKYYKNFRVNVTTSVSIGLFILRELPNGDATLSFQRRDRPNAAIAHDLFEGANPTFGPLGKKPKMVYYKGNLNVQLGVLCSEGERKLSLLNPSNMKLNRALSAETILGGYSGDFSPAYLQLYMGGMIAAGGKLFNYNYMGNESIYSPVVTDTIEFADWADTNNSIDAYAWLGYDNKGERFLQLEPGRNSLLYDKITPLPVQGGFSTTGQKFLAGGTRGMLVRAITHDPAAQKAYLYGLEMIDDMNWDTWEMVINTTVTRFSEITNLINAQTVCFYNTEYWYLANGGTVNRLHEMATEPVLWFTAPKGNVTTMIAKTGSSAGGTNRLLIATYDGSKSYIHEINLATREQIREPIEVEGKVVSLLAKGNWSN